MHNYSSCVNLDLPAIIPLHNSDLPAIIPLDNSFRVAKAHSLNLNVIVKPQEPFKIQKNLIIFDSCPRPFMSHCAHGVS